MKFFLIFIFYSSIANSVECEWWQTKVKSHHVVEHTRNGSPVVDHNRREHCREKWPKADLWGPKIKNESPKDWLHKNEKFKSWDELEIKLLINELEALPSWLKDILIDGIHRAHSSLVKGNAASSILKPRLIVFYDKTFEDKILRRVLVHEFSHHLYEQLPYAEKNNIAKLTGWSYQASSKNAQIDYIPPNKLIMPDSSLGPDEDFSNLIEIYYENPNKIKNYNEGLYQYFTKRFPL